MKLSYRTQMLISVGIIILFNIFSTLGKHWIYCSIGFVLCGILWIVHPVMLPNMEATPKNVTLTRVAGVILILIGVFTRSYIY